jgi:hypothetical protein
MARDVIIGDYGKVAMAADSVVDTGTLTEGAKYIVKTVGGSSTLPTGVEAGYVFVADGTEDITSSGDEVILLTETDKCDIQSWSLDFTKSEIDVTTLCDRTKKYVGGKDDVSGSIDGLYKIDITDAVGGIANSFVDIVKQTGEGGTVTVNQAVDSDIILLLYLQEDKSAGETETFYVVPATLLTFSSAVTEGSASAFSSSLRVKGNPNVNFHLAGVTHTA